MSAPDIRTVLNRIQKTKLTKAINIFFQDDGCIQVSVQRGKAMSFYGHTGLPGEDLADTFLKALANGHGGDLDKALGIGRWAVDEPDELDDDDYSDVI